MATATLFSAVFLQRGQGGSAGSSRGRPAYLRPPCCCRHAPFYSFPLASLHHGRGDADGPTKSASRREAIALFLRSLQVTVLWAPNNNANASESSNLGSFERMEDFERVQLIKLLEMEGLNEIGPVLASNMERPVVKDLGFTVASKRGKKSSGGSLGFLGCLIFGFLFWKERQSRTANDTSLEDARSRIKKANTELCSQTRSSLRWKSENFQLASDVCRDTPHNETLLHELIATKSNVVELGQQLDVQRHVSQSLRQQATDLRGSMGEIERECRYFMEKINKELELRQVHESGLQSINLEAQSKAKEIISLKMALEDQKEVYNEKSKEHIAVEDFLDMAIKKVRDAEVKARSLGDSLRATDDAARSLTKELNFTLSRNEVSKKELNELCKNLQDARESSMAEKAELKKLLNLKKEAADTLSAELTTELGELDRGMKTVTELKSVRDELKKVVHDKESVLNNLMELSMSARERLSIYEVELASLRQQLLDEQVQKASLEADYGSNPILGQLMKVSSEVQGKVDTAKELTARLADELHAASEALRSSKVKVSSLHDSMQSFSTSQAQLKEDLARLCEAQQACTLALKKEKRAAAYAKKKLALCKEALEGGSVVMEGLRNDLEQVRRHVQGLKDQVVSQTSEIEKANAMALCLEDEVSSLKAGLKEKLPCRKDLKVVTPGCKPLQRKSMSRQTSARTRKHSHQSLKVTDKTSADGT